MSYADYEFYLQTFKGSLLSTEDFSSYALQASAYLDLVTFDQLSAIVTAGTDTTTIEKAKMATCAIAEELYRQDFGMRGLISSESVGQHSVTYANVPQSAKDAKKRQLAKLYLASTGLLYAGVATTYYAN